MRKLYLSLSSLIKEGYEGYTYNFLSFSQSLAKLDVERDTVQVLWENPFNKSVP